MRLPSVRRVPALAALVVLLLGLGSGSVPARAAGEDAAPAPSFGGFQLEGHGNGLLFTYDAKGVFPVSPVFQAGLPEANVNLSDTSGYALASLAWPGPLVADLAKALAVGGQDVPIPPWPVRAEVTSPGDVPERRVSTFPGTDMTARANEQSASASSHYAGVSVPGFVDVQAIDVRAVNGTEDGKVVSRTRSVLSGVDLFSGLVRIESLVTDVTARSDGKEATSEGVTTAHGVTVLGLAATLDAQGIHLQEALPAPGNPLHPVTDQVFAGGSPLKPLADGLAPVAQQLSNAIVQVLGQSGSLNDALRQAGIDMRILNPVETKDGASVSRAASGLVINMTYAGKADQRLAPLLALIPSDQLPADSPPGVPMSPQALVNLMKETHITEWSLAPGYVSAAATPAFDGGAVDGSFDGAGGALDTGVLDTGIGTADLGGGTFDPGAGGAPGPSGGDGGRFGGPAGFVPASAIGDAVPVTLVLLAVVLAPFFAGASRRLADGVLAANPAGCPFGKDDADPPGGPRA